MGKSSVTPKKFVYSRWAFIVSSVGVNFFKFSFIPQKTFLVEGCSCMTFLKMSSGRATTEGNIISMCLFNNFQSITFIKFNFFFSPDLLKETIKYFVAEATDANKCTWVLVIIDKWLTSEGFYYPPDDQNVKQLMKKYSMPRTSWTFYSYKKNKVIIRAKCSK